MIESLHWNSAKTPVELRAMLRTLGEEYPILAGQKGGMALSFERADETGLCEVKREGKTALIRYSTPAQAGRAVGALLSGLVPDGSTYRETTPFNTLGIMLDCSRNAVMTVPHLQKWLRRLALLGYNMVMLYTEDTYQLPDEPYFGHQRGAYTPGELKAIDAYAAALNIEAIPCIQTLGHLWQILRHPAYQNVKDTDSVLLVGEPETYRLLEKMIGHWKKVFRTARIHIGMDEAWDLGLGRYLKKFGYRNGFELFNDHLKRVVEICRQHDLRPMIWSDMYFALGSKSGHYYDTSTVIPESAIQSIPQDVQLVYWDYYHHEKSFYQDWIKRHHDMGKPPLMGSGIWTWNLYWYGHRRTIAATKPCIEACREGGVKEIFFTQWGDNGAYCDHDSAFVGMLYCADNVYGNDDPSPESLEKRFAAVCGGSYAAHLLADDIHRDGIKEFQPSMWEDPIFETHFRKWAGGDLKKMTAEAEHFAALAKKLKPHQRDQATGDLKYAYCTAQAFADRYGLICDLLAAYRQKDKKKMGTLRTRIDGVIKSVRAMADAFRTMWMNHNKPEGIELVQGRFGMVEARYRELKLRLGEYLAGKVASIPEWESKFPAVGNKKGG